MPLLMAKEIDFVSAIIVSFKAVRANIFPHVGFCDHCWGANFACNVARLFGVACGAAGIGPCHMASLHASCGAIGL